ncbi:MAG: glycosyltransferase family 2 protein [Nitriliruptorales bacterium]|nr:glycosyltransferase family 2 protein [Nitriliruptorales bacterium]
MTSAERGDNDSDPLISVVVPTFERAALLPGLVTALEAQSLEDPFEVIVVDDGSTDGTADALARLAASSPLNMSIISLPTNAGPAAARNEGVRAARGRFIAFTDDDCRPASGWLAAGLRAFREGAAVVVGATQPEGQPSSPFVRVLRVDRVAWCPTANVFYRRQDVLDAGGFDADFRACAEDADLAMRVTSRTGEAWFEPDALVIHLNRGGTLRSALRIAWRWSDMPLFFKRHPQARRRLAHRRIFWKESHLPAAATILAMLASPFLWPAALIAVPHAWYRSVHRPLGPPNAPLRWVPGVMLVDITEVLACLRGSLRHRTLLL